MSLTTELISGPAVFGRPDVDWDGLATQAMTDTPFQHRAYQRSWWHNLGPEAAELLTVLVRDDDRLIAIASFYLLDQALYFNGCVEETDYLDLICRAEDAERAWLAVLGCLQGERIPAWRAIDLCNVPAESPSCRLLPELARRYDLDFEASVHDVCPVIDLPPDFEAYLGELDRKQRHEIRRKIRRAEAAGAGLKIVGPDDDLSQEVDVFLDLLQKSTTEKEDWLNPGRRAVFHEIAAATLADGTLQLLFFVVDGQKAAALFNFDYRDRIWVYNSGLDPAAFGHLSPGVVLTAWAIERAIDQGRRHFDFLRGDEPYKYRFGAADTSVYRLQLERRRT